MTESSRMPPSVEIRASLARLLRDVARLSPHRVWRALGRDHRRVAIDAALEAGDEGVRRSVQHEVARRFHLRSQTVEAWESDELAERAAGLVPESREVVERLLVALHIHARRAMVVSFLDSLGIAHEDGALVEEIPRVAEGDFRTAAEQLLHGYPPEHILIYFLSLRAVQSGPLGESAGRWLGTDGPRAFAIPGDTLNRGTPVAESGQVVPDRIGSQAAPDEGAVPEEPADDVADEFTTLDRQLIRTVVDVAQGVTGALAHEELIDLIEELLHLNSDRHRSYFHAGFADVVLGPGVRTELPAQNESRLRWYWAGYVTGLARVGRWEEIASLANENEAVRSLGAGEGGASRPAGRLVFDAVCRADRPTQAARLVDVPAIVRDRALFGIAMEEAARLIREDRAADARPILDLLDGAVRGLVETGFDPASQAFLEVKRRRAHCFRQLGELEQARRLLEGLLEEETDPGVRSRTLADLGLVDAGFRRLASLRIPASEDEAETMREALARGEAHFREACEADTRYAGHGRYCLGVLAFLRNEYGAAADHLDEAVSLFTSRPERYEAAGLLATSGAFLAASLCLDLRVPRMDHAVTLLDTALESGLRLPGWILTGIIEALEVAASDLARRTAGMLLGHLDDAGLDLLVGSEAALRSPVVIQALLRRARDTDRSRIERAADYRRLVPHLAAAGERDAAGVALDVLEQAAVESVGRDEFLALLEDASVYGAVWEESDALWSRVRVLESAGEYGSATALLESAFHQTLSRDAFGAGEDARAILERMAEYGAAEDRVEALEGRLGAYAAKRDEDLVDALEGDARPVKILFVGGDERQEKHQEAVVEGVEERDPHVSLSFVHPGWSGNWGGTLEAVQRKLPGHDGVVIMRFVRTEFGRRLRGSLGDTPWRQCAMAGRRAMIESILLVADAARRHLDRLERSMRDRDRD